MEQTEAKTRTIEKVIEIQVPMDVVWKAITDSDELTRWLPLDARTVPGKGGMIWYSWGPPYEGENEILVWDPPRHLKLSDQWAEHSHGEKPREIEAGIPSHVTTDFYLQTERGKTVLRLVHSGFGRSADWDDEFDGTNRGWEFELMGLRHYLERHPGQSRKSVWARVKTGSGRKEVWEKLTSPGGIVLVVGEKHYEGSIASERIYGDVLQYDNTVDFCGTIENWNDAFFRFRLEKSGETIEPNLWLSTYNLPNHRIIYLQDQWSRLLCKKFEGA